MEGKYFVLFLHPPLHLYTYIHNSLDSLPFSQLLASGGGREQKTKESQAWTPSALSLPFPDTSLSLAILASYQCGLISTCSLEPISPVFCFPLPSFPSCYSLYQIFPYFHPFTLSIWLFCFVHHNSV